ncbi:MAG: hypothetical protein E7594_00860 [Ruminococcaceae bacterium]|nr:hypothetical protein [Oscillospiraceae bacterium]
MKKLMTMLLVLTMAISTLTVLATTTSAAELVEGDFITTRSADGYEDEEHYTPAAGYMYTIEGFQVISPDFTNCAPYVQVNTRKPYNLKDPDADGNGNALSVKFTITEYAYGDCDHWIAITLNSEDKVAQGNTNYGSGLCILMRGFGNGATTGQPCYVDQDNNIFKMFTEGTVYPTLNEAGQEEYSFSIRYNGSEYVMNLCGTEFSDSTGELNRILDEKCADGAYLGITLMTQEIETPASFLITEFQGAVPYGEDSAEPEPNVTKVAEIIDSSNVPAGQPAIKWDGKMEQYDKVSLSNGDYTIQENGIVTIAANAPSPYINFGPNMDYTYEASDFPYLAVLYKNCNAESGRFYYMSGKTLGVGSQNYCDFDMYEVDLGEGWGMSIVDLNEDPDWEGKMNGLRLDFYNIDYTDDSMKSFDIAFFGAFRSAEEAEQYAKDTLVALLGKLPETTEKPTEEPTTEAPTTEAKTDAPTEEIPSEEVSTDAEQSGGCKSVAIAPVAALVAFVGVAFVAKKKD